MARNLANLERNIEQLKANQQQIASDNSKAIGELEGDPGRDETRAREGFRAEPAQDITISAADAAGPGLAQARADGSVGRR